MNMHVSKITAAETAPARKTLAEIRDRLAEIAIDAEGLVLALEGARARGSVSDPVAAALESLAVDLSMAVEGLAADLDPSDR